MKAPETLFATIRIPLQSMLLPEELSSTMTRAREEGLSLDDLTVRALRQYVAVRPDPLPVKEESGSLAGSKGGAQ